MLKTTVLIDLDLTSLLSSDTSNWDTDYLIDYHFHNDDQLIYAAKGVLSVETEGGIWVIPPTRAVWVPKEVAHRVHLTAGVQLITLQLSEQISPKIGDACRVIEVSPLLREVILRTRHFPATYGDDSRESRIASIVVDELLYSDDILPLHLPMPTDARAKKVADAFCEDPSQRLSLSEWGRVCGASERTLARLFQAETHLSFGRWQQQARVLHALHLLAAGGSVTTAALDVGFQSSSAFITMFRNVMGSTPAQYFQSAIEQRETEEH